jgi:hypothetical protein
VISYFKNPKSIVISSPLIQGQPTIPCADAKSFRNVAVCCHGIDLPGKYTRGAFRATMREFNLYQLNLRQVAKVMILDAVLYERPLVSVYLFFAGMHCIIVSARLVPPYCVGFLLIQLILNHQHFVQGDGYNLGYKPLTLWEIAKALLYKNDREFPCLEPMYIAKRTKQRKSKEKGSKSDFKDGEDQVVEFDHREFPFSERDIYPKFSVEDALAPSANSKAKEGQSFDGAFLVVDDGRALTPPILLPQRIPHVSTAAYQCTTRPLRQRRRTSQLVVTKMKMNQVKRVRVTTRQ